MEGISFQTRARTIDHLGRGQIADAPTAISELWKNAYDAYASNVALHIFSGEPTVASIFDDGVGMNREDITSKWLVIGTESKIQDFGNSSTDTLGLPERVKQGEKGIGRLSVAFLAPGTILISKRKNENFVVVIVDWRMFENPFLELSDIKLPIAEFSTPEELVKGLPSLISVIQDNLGQTSSNNKHVCSAWERFSNYESSQSEPITRQKVQKLWEKMPINQRHLEEWPVFLGLADHGTAIFMVDLNNELGVWVRPSEVGDEVDEVKDRLRQTLTNFTDPYSSERPKFDYEVFVHKSDGDQRILGANDGFGIDDLHELEHYIEGEFDERGFFTGRIVAFGKDLGIKTFTPKRALSNIGRDRLGPFSFAIGSYEADERRSTHEPNQHALLDQQAEKYSGIFVYRDSLRVMPYGRPDSDFLGFEERRGKHAGRYFFAHRKTFGRIGFTREHNPFLKDKAGREGLVDNRAFREMRLLIIEFVIDAARKYFGTDSPMREEMVSLNMERKLLQKEAADKAKIRRQKSMRQFLKEQSAPLEEAIRQIDKILDQAKLALAQQDRKQATVIASRINEVKKSVNDLRPPLPSSKLGDLETQWRTYRDDYQFLTQKLESLLKLNTEINASIQSEKPQDVFTKSFHTQSDALRRQLGDLNKQIENRLTALSKLWREHVLKDSEKINERIGHLLHTKVTTENLISMLNLVEVTQADLSVMFSENYGAFISALDQLLEGIDLQGAVDISNEFREDLEEQLDNLRAVAQIGITVEIIGHELEVLESEVRRNLAKLPESIKQSSAYQTALSSHQALADRLRFLAPLKIGGYRSRETIRGEQIADYMSDFFSSIFEGHKIKFEATKSFRNISIIDIPSRIYPVFINLVNNSVYWVSQSDKDRNIKLDFQNGLVVIGDSGPGVDPEDVSRLFTMFFTTRRSGRGIGLYLSKANLSVAGHKIRYATVKDPTVANGANFVIDFKGIKSNG